MKRVEFEQIPIAGDDGGGSTVHRHIEELIVLGISAGSQFARDGDDTGHTAEKLHELPPILAADKGVEFWPAKHICHGS